ncbi:TRAP transporter small permease subunit [Granulosicoccus sp. 3-233]|uniref:TRAP transporter small permease subunit n=1 Tax=Granulosicoccus sp. 3-233 TaxID=3417969 RepID=UPI003D344959
MTAFMNNYIRIIDGFNYRIGRFAMYLIFVMIGVLLYSSFTKTFARPSLWTLEMAQFVMVAYYMLGGPYSLQLGSNVRMDLIYGTWSPRGKAWVDSFTVLFLIYYLVVLLIGGFNSTLYAFEYAERSYSAWRPYMWPIKSIMIVGIVMMLLQAVSELFKDIRTIREGRQDVV